MVLPWAGDMHHHITVHSIIGKSNFAKSTDASMLKTDGCNNTTRITTSITIHLFFQLFGTRVPSLYAYPKRRMRRNDATLHGKGFHAGP